MIKIETVIDIIKKDNNFREIIADGAYHFDWFGVTFDKLSYDSRAVDSSTLFFVKGANFEKVYLENAVAAGLKFYIAERDYEVGIPALIVSDVKQAMSLVAMSFYGNPQDKLKILAFTGTKGKTTAAYFAFHILKQSHKVALLSTMNTTLDGETFFKSNLTTPESLDLLKMMAEAVENGVSHLIMEVSSQAYLLKRVYGITFDVGVFLNISPDHIGPIEHPTFEDYFYHKRLLLGNSRAVILNSGMDHADLVMKQVVNQPHDFYGTGTENAVQASTAFTFEVGGKMAGAYDTQLLGDFNQDNGIAAGLACLRLGASLEDIKAGIAQTSVPGRMEVLTQKNGAKVFVDYAHNGDSVDKLIKVVSHYQTGKVILILGSTGNKAESRRKDFGQVINAHPQLEVILTADDPSFEDPALICQEIAAHVERELMIEVDREKAIAQALSMTSQEEDAVIIAGKGTDAYQIINGQRAPYKGDLLIAKEWIEQS